MISTGIATLTALSAPYLLAKESPHQKDQEKPIKGAFPTLDILPEGSILRRVSLPRYDENFVPISLLTAETMTVLDKGRIDGLGVTIHLYAKDGSIDARTKMRHAIYDQKLSTLKVNEAISIQGKSYLANGTGMIYDWKSNRGFLLGPANTTFKKTPPPKSTTMQLTPSPTPRAIAGSLVLLTSMGSSAIAEPPAKLTTAQIEEFEKLTQPVKNQIELEQKKTRTIVAENQQISQQADTRITPFLQSIGQGELLAKTPIKATPEEAKPQAPEVKPANPKLPPVETIKVTCDGGFYFDTDTGIFAYLKNVTLTTPRFNLTCRDELKIFLEKKEEPKTDTKKETKKNEKKNAKKNDGIAAFGDVKRIIATGKVTVKGKDQKNNTFIATAESASYDAKTGEMILSGGLPRLQLGPNQFIQSRKAGQYIRILRSGKLITEGKWHMETTIKKKKP